MTAYSTLKLHDYRSTSIYDTVLCLCVYMYWIESSRQNVGLEMRLIGFVLFGANLMVVERNKAMPVGDLRRETEVVKEKRFLS